MPDPGGSKTLARRNVKIEAGDAGRGFRLLVKKVDPHVGLVRRLVAGEPDVAINPKHRPARVSDQMRRNLAQLRPEVADKTKSWVPDLTLVSLLVCREPFPIGVVTQFAKKCERFGREVAHQRRLRSSLPGLKRIVLPGGSLTSTPVFRSPRMPSLRCLTSPTPTPRSAIRW